MSSGTSIGAWVDDETAAKAKQRAGLKHGGKVSAYLAALIRADLDGEPTGLPSVSDRDAILELVRRFHPALEVEILDYLGPEGTHRGVNQPRLLARLIEAIPDFLDSYADDTRSRLRIIPEPSLRAATTAALKVAEDRSDYGLNPAPNHPT